MQNRKLALGSVLNVANLVLTAVSSMALMPYVVHTVGDGPYGVWLIIGTFVGYFGLFDFGLSATVNRYLATATGAGDTDRAQSILSTALLLFSVVGIVVLAATGILALTAGRFRVQAVDLSTLREALLVAGAAFALGFPIRAITGVLQARLRYDVVASREIATLVVRTALVIVAMRLGWGLPGLAWASLVALVLPSIGLVRVARRIAPELRFDLRSAGGATARELVSFSAFAFIGQLADVLRFRVGALVVGHFAGGAVAVTHFGIAATLIQYFISLMTAALGVFGGVLSRQSGAGDAAALHRTFLFATKLAVVLASFVGFGLVAWGGHFIERWMGPGYRDVHPALVALAVGCTFALWQVPSVWLLFSIKRHKFYATANVVEGVANLAVSIALAPRYGIMGVAFGTLIPMTVVKLIAQPIYVCRSAGIPLGHYARTLARTVGVVAVCLVPVAAFTWLWGAPTFPALASLAALGAVTYGPLAFRFALTEAERSRFTALLGRRSGLVPAAQGAD